jgi:hypothetical protein
MGNHAILYDGHILNLDLTTNNEWAVDDAIYAYEQKKREERKREETRIRQIIREELRKE